MFWSEQASYLVLQIKFLYLRDVSYYRRLPSSQQERQLEKALKSDSSLDATLSLHSSLGQVSILARSLSLCPSSSLQLGWEWRQRSVYKKRKASLDPGSWFGVEVLGDSGKGGCCLRRQRERERETPVFYTRGRLKLLSLSSLPDVSCDYYNI